MTRYCVIGAGAIGTVVAAHLDDVAVLARGPRLAALRMLGLVLETPRGTLAKDVLLVDAFEGEVALICTKTNDVERALAPIPRATPVVMFTNGLEAERIATRLGFAHVYGVYVMCPATYLEPRAIQAYGTPVPGIFDVGPRDELSERLAGELVAGGLRARAIEGPELERWKRAKLIGNLANAVTALAGPASQSSQLVAALREEGRRVFAAAGLPLATPEEEAARRGDFSSVPKAGGGSTWQSLVRGGPIEADYLNGEIVRLARACGIDAPLNAAILQLVNRATTAGEIDIRDLERSLLTNVRFPLE